MDHCYLLFLTKCIHIDFVYNPTIPYDTTTFNPIAIRNVPIIDLFPEDPTSIITKKLGPRPVYPHKSKLYSEWRFRQELI